MRGLFAVGREDWGRHRRSHRSAPLHAPGAHQHRPDLQQRMAEIQADPQRMRMGVIRRSLL